MKWTQWKSYITYEGKWNSTSTFRTYFPFWSQIHVRYQHIIRVNVYFVKIDAGMAVYFIWAKMTFLRVYREILWYFTSKVRFRNLCGMSRITPFSVTLVFHSAARLHDTLVERTWRTGRMQEEKNESNIDFIFKFKENFVF